jgi:AraC family transcriptional regulator
LKQLPVKTLDTKDHLLPLISSAIEFIENNLRQQISIKSVTDSFEQSHWYFQRLFASVVGVTIGQYLRERRLTESALSLRSTHLRVLDLALEYGFGSEEAYTRSFKNYFGISPTQYRHSTDLVLITSRNKISSEKLSYFWNNVQRTPEVVECPERFLIGTSIEFDSHFILGSSCHLKIVPHWADFKARIHEIPYRSNQERIGAVVSTELDLRNEQLTYFSGVEVDQVENVPEKMLTLKLQKGLYARFESSTLSEKNGHLMDYIYGIWLPSSGYQRAPGYDYEIFDHRYVVTDPKSVSNFFVPIEKCKN